MACPGDQWVYRNKRRLDAVSYGYSRISNLGDMVLTVTVRNRTFSGSSGRIHPMYVEEYYERVRGE